MIMVYWFYKLHWYLQIIVDSFYKILMKSKWGILYFEEHTVGEVYNLIDAVFELHIKYLN